MDILFWAHLLNGLLMIAMPVGLAIFLTLKWKLGWRLWFIGAATFILSQVGHIPFNALVGWVLNQTDMVNWSPTSQTIFNAIFAGLSAGMFEEWSRYGMYRWWAKDARSWRTGILAGAGHGGVEAIILGVLVFVSFLQLVAYRNIDLATVVPADQLQLAQSQISAYWSATWYDSLLGAVERAFAIPLHIACSVLVIQTFIRKQGFWVWIAVLFHAAADTFAVFGVKYLNVYQIEGAIGLFAIVSVLIIFALRQPEPIIAEPEPSASPDPIIPLKPIDETIENLNNSKYQ